MLKYKFYWNMCKNNINLNLILQRLTNLPRTCILWNGFKVNNMCVALVRKVADGIVNTILFSSE
jgi:hypothetical protein